jgi:hypothetical protein
MNGNAARFVQFAAGLVALVTLGWVVTGQAAKPPQQGVPTDWTHQHTIFSRPATEERARQVERDPRYWQQWYRDNIVRVVSVDGAAVDETRVTPGVDQSVAHPKVHRDWSEDMGAGATVGAGNYPAKYSFSIATANCGSAPQPDFVVFSTGLQSSGTVASIVAYDNLYSGCTGTVPSTYWAYNTSGSAPGTIKTSPIFSLDGTQIAFVQTDGLSHGTVVLLKWAAGTGTLSSPAAPNLVTAANYAACTAPCMTTFDLRTGANVQTDDTTSSVGYDYTGDVAWVGDSGGLLHQFHPFFNGTPAEVRTAPWPVKVNPANPIALSSPVFDQVSRNVFVGDAGGFLERVSSTTGVSVVSGQVDFATGVLGPAVVDQTIGKVYVFSSNNGNPTCLSTNPCAAVYQFTTSFGAGTTGTQTHVGVGGSTNPMYAGGFDSAYRSSRNGTGSLYVCGDTGGAPTLYQLKINAGALPAAATFSAAVTADSSRVACSPVTDIPNPNLTTGAEERVFVSAQNNGRATPCASKGCLISFINTPWKANTAYIVGQEILGNHIEVAITGGTSGTTTPVWTSTLGQTITDGTVKWIDQGTMVAGQLGTWTKSTSYIIGVRIVDTNGNVEIVTTPGTTGTNVPTWPTIAGATTTDNTVTYINGGALPTASLQTASGASGVIMDNTVGSGTLAGASQVYFSTLGDQVCPTSGGNGGCAVQASQSALK